MYWFIYPVFNSGLCVGAESGWHLLVPELEGVDNVAMIPTCDVTSVGREATSHGTAQTPSMDTRGHLLGMQYSSLWYPIPLFELIRCLQCSPIIHVLLWNLHRNPWHQNWVLCILKFLKGIIVRNSRGNLTVKTIKYHTGFVWTNHSFTCICAVFRVFCNSFYDKHCILFLVFQREGYFVDLRHCLIYFRVCVLVMVERWLVVLVKIDHYWSIGWPLVGWNGTSVWWPAIGWMKTGGFIMVLIGSSLSRSWSW